MALLGQHESLHQPNTPWAGAKVPSSMFVTALGQHRQLVSAHGNVRNVPLLRFHQMECNHYHLQLITGLNGSLQSEEHQHLQDRKPDTIDA